MKTRPAACRMIASSALPTSPFDPPQAVGLPAGVAPVAVGEKPRGYGISRLDEPGEVRMAHVPPEVAARKPEPAVHHGHLLPLRDGQGVHADLAEPAQRDQPD